MKLRDLRAPNITFPIKIPIRYKYVYKPPKNVPKVEHHDVLSFDNMSGNGKNNKFKRFSYIQNNLLN